MGGVFALSMMSIADVAVLPTDSLVALHYQQALNALWIVSQAYLIVFPALLVFTGVAIKFNAIIQKHIGQRDLASVAVSVFLFSLLFFVFRLPLGYVEAIALPQKFALPHPSITVWSVDKVTGLVVPVLAALFGCMLFALIRRFRRTWWLVASLLTLPLLAFVLIVSPALRKGEPLQNPGLEKIAHDTAQRVGLSELPVTVLKNGPPVGYVTGFGGTQHVVFSQAALNVLEPDEFGFILAHELRHFLMGDLWKLAGTVFFTILLAAFGAHLLAVHVLRKWPERFGIAGLASPVMMLILAAGFASTFTLLVPLINWVSRDIERQADVFALELTHANDAAAASVLRRYEVGPLMVVDPGWFQMLFRETHDSTKERIALAMEYRPWERGLPLKYGSIIHAPPSNSP